MIEEVPVVRYEDQGAREFEQPLLEPIERGEVEVVRRLVEQQEVGTLKQGAGERGARFLAAREVARGFCEIRLGEADSGQGGANGGLDLVAATGRESVQEVVVAVEVLLCGARGEASLKFPQLALGLLERRERRLHGLEQRPGALQPRRLRQVTDARPADEANGPGRRRLVPGQEPKERRLSHAVVADQRDAISGSDLRGERGEQGVSSERLRELLDLDERHDAHGT